MTDNEERLVSVGFDDCGAFGPTIVVQLRSEAAVLWLRQLFVDVAEGLIAPELAVQPQVRLIGIDRLELALATPDMQRELIQLEGKVAFVWACSSERWHTNAALLDPFLEGRTGHQYLTSEGVDDALIEVSFGEAHPGL